LYDVSDPVHPRLLCTIAFTTAHLFTGDTFEYLKPVSANETDVILHSLGSGNESVVGKFPFNAAFGSWLPDLSAMTFAVPGPEGAYSATTQVWLYSQRRLALLYTYPIGIGDCICRFGLPPQVLAISPDGQYLVAGWLPGRAAVGLAVYRISDRTRVKTLDPSVTSAFWARTGHRLFLEERYRSQAEQSWTPEAGVSNLAGAGSWAYLPGPSPDGSKIAYTAYADPTHFKKLRAYVYDMRAGSTRMLVDKLRSQVLFVKDGWVWYLEEAACDPITCGAPWGTELTGKVFAMQLSAGTETVVRFAAGENLVRQSGGVNWANFGPGEFWPAS
jgi:Tol biopolymer transport system component